MEEKITANTDLCICCGEPVPEGRMVCYACETGYTPTPVVRKPEKQKNGLKALLGLIKEKPHGPRN